MRYTKSSSHLLMAHQAMGDAMTTATSTNFIKSVDNIATMPDTDAPSTLRMPISLVRWKAVNAANPNSPKQLMNIVIPVATLISVDVWRSLVYRSEEHTSELQSLMRKSYAVFCMKNKKNNNNNKNIH